jgi:hypothetical protein
MMILQHISTTKTGQCTRLVIYNSFLGAILYNPYISQSITDNETHFEPTYKDPYTSQGITDNQTHFSDFV